MSEEKKAKAYDALFKKGLALGKQGKHEQALEFFIKAIELCPTKEKAWYNKGVALASLARNSEALEAYDKTIELNPKYDKAYSNKGNVLSRLGNLEAGLELHNKAIEINPANGKAWYNKGNDLFYLGKFEEALQAYDKAIKLDSKFASSWFNKGITLSNLGRYSEALEAYDKTIELNPKNDKAYSGKGSVLSKLGKFEEALELQNKAIEINPTNEKAWHNKGNVLSKLGKFEDALQAYDKVIELNSSAIEVRVAKGIVLRNLGRDTQALRCFNEIIELNPNDAFAWYNKAITLGSLGRFRYAFRSAIKAYRLSKPVSDSRKFSPKPQKENLDEEEVIVENINPTDAEWVRVALVQLNYSLSLDEVPNEFGYKLQDKEEVRSKIFKALEIATANKANIICFPELCVEEAWIEEARKRYKDCIIIFGSFYKHAFNTCPIIAEGRVYYVQKISPSPLNESDTGTGRCMKSGRQIVIFQTKFGRFVVLICRDFLDMVHKIVYNPDEKKNKVDFVIVPSRNRAVDLFQKRGDLVCQEDDLPFVLQVNTVKINDEDDAGGTCIIGMDHTGALNRYKQEGWKPNDDIKYKLFEASGEVILCANLDIKRKGAPIPARDFKMKNALAVKIE
jgi:tetratricopeptide (TPR) repeat protein